MPPRLFLVDLGNVLLKLDFDRFCEGAAERGTRTAQEIRAQYIHGDAKKELERGRCTADTFLEEMREWLHWPKTANARDHLRALWCDIFDEMPGAQEGLEELKSMGQVWIVSDTDPLHHDWFRSNFPYVTDVDRLWFSYEIGHLKAEPGVFERIVEQAARPAEEILFLDDIPRNIEAAKKVGLSTHLFTNWEELWTNTEIW
ncbi:HAD-IA family hydrolase [bacterium]|nr:HAD-IA family hydrolase [bacterium]